MFAPICLFVYNRPNETQRLLDTLSCCPEASQCQLIVFSDGPKHQTDQPTIDAVRRIITSENRFADVELHEAERNQGLANSVISGVSKTLQSYDSIIVLEDDLEVSSDFLTFMNAALNTYRDRKDIWSISGYTPIAIPNDYPHDIFLVQRPQCWGWATWNDRWNTVDWDARQAKVLRNCRQRYDFDRGGNDLSRTMDMWQKGRIDVWAIRWVFSAWLQHTWTINPVGSKVRNAGFTATATHRGWHDQRHEVSLDNTPITLERDILPNNEIIEAFKAHHDLGLVSKIGYFLRCHNLGYSFFKKLLHH